jgi:hypothetical protein
MATVIQRIQLRNDTAANWTSGDPTLQAGELGHETDTGKFKLGTGVLAWTSLSYASILPGVAAIVDADINASAAIAGSKVVPTFGSQAVTSATSIGYTTGAGGTVTQLTSKATAVTLDKTTGQITTHNAALAAATEVTFTVDNSTVAATDTVIVNLASGGTTNTYIVGVHAVAAGSFNIIIGNMSATSRSEVLVLNFAIIKGVSA